MIPRRAFWSMYYLAGYLLPAGVGLLIAPDFFLKVLGNNQDFGQTTPRMLGATLLALGVLVVGILRHRIAPILPYTVIARLTIIAVFAWLGFTTGNPVFLSLNAIVGLGVFLTLLFSWMDRREVQ